MVKRYSSTGLEEYAEITITMDGSSREVYSSIVQYYHGHFMYLSDELRQRYRDL